MVCPVRFEMQNDKMIAVDQARQVSKEITCLGWQPVLDNGDGIAIDQDGHSWQIGVSQLSALKTLADRMGVPNNLPIWEGNNGFNPAVMDRNGSMESLSSLTDKIFDMIDRNQNGVISKREFEAALQSNVIESFH